MIIIVSSRRYLHELDGKMIEAAAMIFLLYADRFDIIKNKHGEIKLNLPITQLNSYLAAAAEIENRL